MLRRYLDQRRRSIAAGGNGETAARHEGAAGGLLGQVRRLTDLDGSSTRSKNDHPRILPGGGGTMIRSSLGVLDEVPTIPIEIFEHGDQAVGLLARWPNESDPGVYHSMVVAPEIIRRKEEEHPPARLVSDKRLLLRLGCPSEQQRRTH